LPFQRNTNNNKGFRQELVSVIPLFPQRGNLDMASTRLNKRRDGEDLPPPSSGGAGRPFPLPPLNFPHPYARILNFENTFEF